MNWLSAGRQPISLASNFSKRRTIYGLIDAQNLPGVLRTFDFATPDTHSPKRFVTTVPQQALYLMNNPFVVEQAKRLAGRHDVADLHENSVRALVGCLRWYSTVRRQPTN